MAERSGTGKAPMRHGNFDVSVEGPGISETHFNAQGVMGIGVESEVVEFQQGGQSDSPLKFPGPTRYRNITIKRGVLTYEHGRILKWLSEMGQHQEGTAKQRGKVTITLNNDKGEAQLTFTLVNAWPVKWELGPMEGTGRDLILKSVEFAFERMETSSAR